MGFQGSVNLSAFQMREMLSGLEQDETKIAQILTARSELTESEMRDLFRQGDSKGPDFALQRKVINGIRDFVIPVNAPMIHISVK